MSQWFGLFRILHVIAAVFMAAPLYMLIVVGERGAFGKTIEPRMDGYMERIISGQPRRCYMYLGILFVTGLAFFLITGQGLRPVVANWMITVKVVLTLIVLGIITYVHRVIQPQVNALIARAGAEDVAARVWSLRRRRKRLTATCLFLVLVILLLGVRLVVGYSPWMLVLFVALAALFAWRAYNAPVSWGFA